jgi:hypothetical protein
LDAPFKQSHSIQLTSEDAANGMRYAAIFKKGSSYINDNEGLLEGGLQICEKKARFSPIPLLQSTRNDRMPFSEVGAHPGPLKLLITHTSSLQPLMRIADFRALENLKKVATLVCKRWFSRSTLCYGCHGAHHARGLQERIESQK